MSKLIQFVKDAYSELKKVKFPTREQAIRLTMFVIGVSLAVGLFVSGFDYLFTEALEITLGR
jgi:preprotein translocase SecE subunit